MINQILRIMHADRCHDQPSQQNSWYTTSTRCTAHQSPASRQQLSIPFDLSSHMLVSALQLAVLHALPVLQKRE